MTLSFSGRVEARMTVPTGGAAVSATNSGGGPTTVTLPAGSYYMTAAGGIDSLIDEFEAQLNATRAPSPGAWDVSMSTTTGLVSIDCTSGTTVQKTSGGSAWNGGASTQSFTGDGWIETTCTPPAAGQQRLIGLDSGSPPHDFQIDWALYFGRTGADSVDVYENSNPVTATTFVSGDVFAVKRTGTTITYLKNGVVFYTSLISTSATLTPDTGFYEQGGVFYAVRVYDNGTQITPVWSSTNTTQTDSTWSLSFTDTNLRDALGFTANISNVTTSQTGTQQAEGVWYPDCPLFMQGDPARAPRRAPAGSSMLQTGELITYVGLTHRRHRGLVWSHVTIDRVWEAEATYANASWEAFFNETQLGLGSSWFKPGSPIQIYDHNGICVGVDASVAGWYIVGIRDIEPRRTLIERGYTGLWRIELPAITAVNP